MEQITVNYEEKPCYTISLAQDFDNLAGAMAPMDLNTRKVCIVTDSTVEKLYLNEVVNHMSALCRDVVSFSFPAGEESKTLNVIQDIYETLIMNHFDRKDVLIALGGGVVGDMTGYAAATYLRGIRFAQIPTTLLSMVDSSIGGKTGVDFKAYKNMVGAFHQPSAVYMNLSVLKTLSKEQFRSGVGEIVKHAVIKNSEYYNWLKQHVDEILSQDSDILMTMIKESLLIKKDVVERDPKEAGERALLNFGHTIGHAIEKHMNFTMLHGDCVAVGIVAASYLSYQRGYLTQEEFEDICNLLKEFTLPTSIKALSANEVIETTKSDKKMEAGNIRFILAKRIGEAFIDTTVSNEEMKKALEFIMQ